MKILTYDVFVSDTAFGNPCGVVELDRFPSDIDLLHITCGIGLPVTSFIVKKEEAFHIRWFSKESEINLCGHGSLGAGAYMMSQYHLSDVTFCSKHGEVCISKQNGLYTIILPSWEAQSNSVKVESLGVSDMEPLDVFSTRDIVLVLPNEECVANFNPHYNFLKKMEDHHALIVTAQNRSDGYVLRYFAPKIGIPEDIATGSAQCSLAPYWFSKLGVYSLTAHQLSSSGGYFKVEKESESSIKVFAQVKAREENI